METRRRQLQFKRFTNNEYEIYDKSRSGRQLTLNEEYLTGTNENDPCQNTRDLMPNFVRHIQQFTNTSRELGNLTKV